MPKRKKTILVIDDESSVRKAIQEILRGREYRVLEADGYEEALSIIGEGHGEIDMLLIDVSLPGKSGLGNGFMIAEALRKIDADLRLLFMSGHVGAEWSRYHGVPVTDVHFLPKPFTADELLDRVKHVLSWTALLFARGAL
jgi:DNA-binding response OmpR family regulator